jgi:hypothetical protein
MAAFPHVTAVGASARLLPNPFFCGTSRLRNPRALEVQRLCRCEKWLSPDCTCRPAFDCSAYRAGEVARRVGGPCTMVRPPPKAKSKLEENVEIAEWL